MSLSRKRRFARNLDKLLRARNLTRKEAAAGALVPYQWLRRAVAEGISRIEARNSGHLSSLAEYLGLPDPDRFWDGGLYVEPARDLTEYEAGRIGELMREYVALVGPNDGLVRLIVGQLGPAVHQERDRKWRLEAVKKAAEEAEAAGALGRRLDESLRRWQAYREALSSVLAHGKSEKDLRKSEFKATAEDAERARRAIEFFRTQFVDGWRAISLPHAEEIRLDPWLVAVHTTSTDGPSHMDFASVVRGMWMSEYARRLDKTVQEAEDFIRSYVRNAYGMDASLVVARTRQGSLVKGRTGTVVKGRAPADGRKTSAGDTRVEIPAIIDEALEVIRRAVARRLESDHEGRERMAKPEEGVAPCESRDESDASRPAFEGADLVWLPKHSAMLEMAVEEAMEFIKKRVLTTARPAEPETRAADVLPGSAPLVGYEARRRIAGREAVSLTPRVFAAFAPGQASRLIQIHGCEAEAEAWVQEELYEELSRLQFEAAPSSPGILDRAVEAVVERAMKDDARHRAPAV